MIIDFAKLNNTPGPGPSGAAWGGITGNINNQTDLMNKFGGYTQPSDFKTINQESIVGSGDIVISGGLTPEQEAAIEPLENTSAGLLYTKSIGSQKVDFCPLNGVGQYDSGWIYQVDDDVYFSWAQNLYKFNKDKQSFDYIVYLQTNNWQKYWTDMTGRFYQGSEYMFDLTTGNYTTVYTDALYNTFDNRSNIIKLNDAVYCINYQQAQKFNESTQKFESYPITLPSGFTDGVAVVSHIRKYDGRWISVYNNTMWELLEYEDHLEIVELSTPLFDIQINDSYIEGSRIYSCEGSLFYLYQSSYYRLNSEGHWESINITYNDPEYSGWTVYYSEFAATSGKYIVGGFNHPQGLIKAPVTNPFSEDQKVTDWYGANQVGLVDITSQQNITGSKHFDQIEANSIIATYIHQSGSELSIIGNINNINAASFKTNTSFVLLNDKLAATTDKCILNRTELPYGPYKDVIINGGLYTPFGTIYTTHTGRVFCSYDSETREFTGSAWVTRSTMYIESPRYRVLTTANNTFYIDFNSSSTYIWDDANTDWVRICNWTYDWIPTQEIWSDGTDARYSGMYKLVENGGVWSWETDSDYANTFKIGRYFIINNVLYCVSQNDSAIYSVDTTQHTYTKLNTNDIVCIDSEYIFEFDGKIFYRYNCGSNIIYIIDMTTYTASLTDIMISSPDWPLFVYSNALYGIDMNHDYDTYRVYGLEEEVPAVPAQDGVYTLQATVSDGEVTYAWVSAVI